MCFLRLMLPCHSAFMKRAHLQLSDRAARTGSIRYSVPPGLKNIWYRDVFIFLVPTWYRSTGSSDNTTTHQATSSAPKCRPRQRTYREICIPEGDLRGADGDVSNGGPWPVSIKALSVSRLQGNFPTRGFFTWTNVADCKCLEFPALFYRLGGPEEQGWFIGR